MGDINAKITAMHAFYSLHGTGRAQDISMTQMFLSRRCDRCLHGWGYSVY